MSSPARNTSSCGHHRNDAAHFHGAPTRSAPAGGRSPLRTYTLLRSLSTVSPGSTSGRRGVTSSHRPRTTHTLADSRCLSWRNRQRAAAIHYAGLPMAESGQRALSGMARAQTAASSALRIRPGKPPSRLHKRGVGDFKQPSGWSRVNR